MTFQKDGPKRRRYTRRELPNGQVSEYGKGCVHFKHERDAKRDPTVASNSADNNNERTYA